MFAKQNFIAKLSLILLIVGMGSLPIASTMHAGTHLSPTHSVSHSSGPTLSNPHRTGHSETSQHCGLCILLHRSLFALALCAPLFLVLSKLSLSSIFVAKAFIVRYTSPSPPRAPPVFAQ